MQAQEEIPISLRSETHIRACREQNIQQEALDEPPVLLRREVYLVLFNVKEASIQAQEKLPGTVTTFTGLQSEDVQYCAKKEYSDSMKYEIRTVAYILKNVQSCTQNGNSVTHALCPA
jgi:hypothetical protein